MNTRRPARVVVALTLGSLLVAACSSTASTNGPTSSASDDQSLAKVKDAEELVVGTEGTYRPFSYHENGSGDLTGYDVEVIRAVAEKLGVDVRFEETQWDAIFAGLEAGRFDVIANQVSITPEREAAYTFSAPYTYSPGVIVVRADDGSITSFESLAGKATAQSLTSNWYALAEENGASIEAVEGWAQAIALVEQSRVDATINDKLTFLDYKTQTGAAGLKVAAQTDEVSRNAFALRSGAVALADAIDGALAELATDGTLAKISTEFFGEDVSQQ